jgi:hypothetical protein
MGGPIINAYIILVGKSVVRSPLGKTNRTGEDKI